MRIKGNAWVILPVTVVALIVAGVFFNARNKAPQDFELRSGTGAPATTRAQIEANYRDFWDVYIKFGSQTGPFDPQEAKTILSRISTGEEYQKLYNYFQLNRLNGLVLRGRPKNDPTISIVIDAPDRATVKDCMADTGGIYRVDNNRRVDTPTQGRQLVTAYMVLEEGVWKVASLTGNKPCSL